MLTICLPRHLTQLVSHCLGKISFFTPLLVLGLGFSQALTLSLRLRLRPIIHKCSTKNHKAIMISNLSKQGVHGQGQEEVFGLAMQPCIIMT